MSKSCQIFYTYVSHTIITDAFDMLIKNLPRRLQVRLLRYNGQKEKNLSLVGKLLLSYGLKQIGFNNGDLDKLYYTRNGRPYFEGSSIDFNISHSEQMVACAIVEDFRVGVDIQYVVSLSQKALPLFLHPLEVKKLDDYQKITIWTKKEAISKVSGEGLGLAFKEIYCPEDLCYQNGKHYYTNIIDMHDDYVCCVAFNNIDVDIIQSNIPLNNLLF